MLSKSIGFVVATEFLFELLFSTLSTEKAKKYQSLQTDREVNPYITE